MTALLIGLQLWVGQPRLDPQTLLAGHWQSCREDDGYAERIYDHCVLGVCTWSLHMGPFADFALYRYTQNPVEPDHTHNSRHNLLGPRFTVDAEYGRGRRTWNLPSVRIWVNIVRAGGSTDACEGFYVLIRRLPAVPAPAR